MRRNGLPFRQHGWEKPSSRLCFCSLVDFPEGEGGLEIAISEEDGAAYVLYVLRKENSVKERWWHLQGSEEFKILQHRVLSLSLGSLKVSKLGVLTWWENYWSLGLHVASVFLILLSTKSGEWDSHSRMVISASWAKSILVLKHCLLEDVTILIPYVKDYAQVWLQTMCLVSICGINGIWRSWEPNYFPCSP